MSAHVGSWRSATDRIVMADGRFRKKTDASGRALWPGWGTGNWPTRQRVASNGEKVCQMISPTGVRRIEAESACLSPMKFSIGPTNSMYRRNGFRKRWGTSDTRPMQLKES